MKLEVCGHCGKNIRKPVYAPTEDYEVVHVYHQRCLDILARKWDRKNNTKRSK